MTDATPIPFFKMHGLGNDFAIFDGRERPLALEPQHVRWIADRDGQIGCDQVIVMEPSSEADVFMRIYNADGGEVEACGNAARCIAMLMVAETEQPQVTIETQAAIVGAVVNQDGTVTVDMGKPRFKWDEIPLSEEFRDTRAVELQVGPIDDPVLHSPSVVNVGNPHCIFWVDDLDDHDLGAIGSILENHPLFPERANISLAHVTSPQSLTLRVWERGAGLTSACGTAACAAVTAAARKKLTERSCMVILPGGPLHIDWREMDDHILMTGPAAFEYEGGLDPAVLTADLTTHNVA